MRKISIIVGFFSLICFLACKSDKFIPTESDCPEDIVAYDTNMKAIVDLNCAYSTCHDGGGGAPGNYTSYEGMRIDIDRGIIETRVLLASGDLKMPPDYADLGPTDLSEEDLRLFICWIEGGYPEN